MTVSDAAHCCTQPKTTDARVMSLVASWQESASVGHPCYGALECRLRVDSRTRLSRRSAAQNNVRRDGARRPTWHGVHAPRRQCESSRRAGTPTSRFAAWFYTEELR